MHSRDAARGGHSDRGQTNMDFAVGVGIFLLATAFVFTFVPTIITPFEAGIGGAENAQADRIADHVVDELTEQNELHGNWQTTLDNWDDLDNGGEGWAEELGLRSGAIVFDRVNIQVAEIDPDANGGNPVITWVGATYEEGQTAASASRIVVSETAGECEPACRITVRVW